MSKVSVAKYFLLFFMGAGTVVIAQWYFGAKAHKRLVQFFIGAFVLMFVVGVDAYLIEPYWIQVRKVTVHDERLAEVLKGTKIVQITDIHMGHGIGFREWQMIQKVNALKPDLIFFTGDVVDNLAQIGPAQKLFRSLKAKQGIYGVPGDTDTLVLSSAEFKREMSAGGMDVLLNESRGVRLSNGNILWLLGLDNPRYHDESIRRASAGVPQGVPRIMLSASPDTFGEAAEAGINLLLVGDTHGGQVGIDWLIRMSEYANRSPYMRGLFHKMGTSMYVNRGIGTKTRPVRFLCRPEIAVFEIKK